MHDTAKLANRDIKPENILFATTAGGTNNVLEDRAQIADFTTVVDCSDPTVKVNDRAGTEAFSPPECVDSSGSYYPKPVDVWSLGVSIYCMMFEVLPFSLDNLKHEIITKEIAAPECSESLKSVFSRLLEKDAGQRATIK